MPYEEFQKWLPEYVHGMPDEDLLNLMKYLGLTIVTTSDKWNGVFIIHSSKDEAHVKAIRFGLNCINLPDTSIYCSSIDDTGTALGESFVATIKNCLQNALLVICVMSDNSVNSKYCLQEMGAAFILDTALIPVLVDGFDPADVPGFIDGTRYQAASISTASAAGMFLTDVCRKCGKECNPVDLMNGVKAIITEEVR